jgi:hypothetical protein
MQLRPRHFVLFAIVLALFAVNILRHRRHQPVSSSPPAPVVTTPPPTSSAWTAFDHAAGLRDAPDPQFQPAFQDLQQQIAATPAQPGMEGCLTWLEFYRQGVLHPARDPQWKTRSQHHLDGCVHYHADLSS